MPVQIMDGCSKGILETIPRNKSLQTLLPVMAVSSSDWS
jgi:hypothetical protein